MKNLKPVPADKKKSLGKLPTDVRNKMGYAQKGKMMKTIHSTDHPDVKMTQKLYAKNKIYAGSKEEVAKNLDEIQNKIAKKRTKTEGSFSKGGGADMSTVKSRKQKMIDALREAAKKGGKVTGKITGQMSEAEIEKLKSMIPKKAKGGEMKKPMKAVLGAAVLGAIGAKAIGKAMKKKASASPGMDLLSKESGMKLPMKDLYQKATEQQMAKKSMGGEMKSRLWRS